VDYFQTHGVPAPRLDAELLLAHALGQKRIDLYLGFDRPVAAADRERYRELVKRRAVERVPVSYLTGTREFWSMSFRATPDVLIPRPETETLVRVAVELGPERVVEVGTGSGCVAAAIAAELPDARVLALDSSAEALVVARHNLEAHGLASRVELQLALGLSGVRGSFDAVVSNPPYIPSEELAGLPDEVRHEPRLALDGGPDGLAVVRQLIEEAPERLTPGGSLVLEVGSGQARAVEKLLLARGASRIDIHRDLAGTERVVASRFGEGGRDGQIRD
jgi:release factor glutamine methyltransferase